MTTLNSDSVGQLLTRLQRLRADARPLWGRMNAHQMVCHLHDTMLLAIGVRKTEDAGTALSRTAFRWMALRLPVPWPKNYPTRPEFDQLAGGTRPVEFTEDVSSLVCTLEQFARRTRSFPFGRHPVFGALTEWEWKRWAYLHADHHLRQFGL